MVFVFCVGFVFLRAPCHLQAKKRGQIKSKLYRNLVLSMVFSVFFFTENPERKSSFVLPLVTIVRALSPCRTAFVLASCDA